MRAAIYTSSSFTQRLSNSGRKWDMELKPNHTGVSGHHTILHFKALNLHKTVKKVTL